MLAPPEPDTYARRFPHFVQPTHAVTCGTVTQKLVRIPYASTQTYPDPKSSSFHAFNAHQPSISDVGNDIQR